MVMQTFFLPIKKFVIKVLNFVIIYLQGTQNQFALSVNSMYSINLQRCLKNFTGDS